MLDKVLGLGFDLLDGEDVAVEFADVGAEEGVAFPELQRVASAKGEYER